MSKKQKPPATKIYTWEQHCINIGINRDAKEYVFCITCYGKNTEYIFNHGNKYFYFCHDCFFNIYDFLKKQINTCNCNRCLGLEDSEHE